MMLFFRAVSPTTISGLDLPEHEVGATRESLKTGLPEYFGHKVDFLGERLHGYLTDNCPLKKVYFADYLQKIYNPLNDWIVPQRDKMQIIFDLLDWDQDGILKGKDLLTTWRLVPHESKFGQEINTLIAHYFDTHIRIEDIKPKDPDIIYFEKFLFLMSKSDGRKKSNPSSCLLKELATKPLMGPQHTKESVFIPTYEDIRVHHSNPKKFPYVATKVVINDEFLEKQFLLAMSKEGMQGQ